MNTIAKRGKNVHDCECGFFRRLGRDILKYKVIYLMLVPALIYYAIFCYKPMYGAIIAFKNYSPALGIMGSPWAGLEHFRTFFSNPDFVRILRNTLIISISTLIFCFPASIILALLFNELQGKRLKKLAQTVSYLPHFISLVVVCGLIKQFVSTGGVVHQIYEAVAGPSAGLLSRKEFFVPIYIISDLWQGVGWGSIIYLAALSGIDSTLYEAAMVDGANKWKQVIHITIPGILPTIVTMLILRVGQLMNLGSEKILLLYNSSILETSDVISTYVYRVGIANQSWSYSTAVGLFNSVINFSLVILANYFSKKLTDTSLW